jgi:hypothetical protein
MKIELKGSPWKESDETFWPNILRVAHLKGGLTASNSPKKPKIIKLRQATLDSKVIEIRLTAYRDLALALDSSGFGEIIGIDFYETEEQIRGVQQPLWMANSPTCDGVNGLFENNQFWRKVRHHGYTLKDPKIIDIAGRIGQQLWTLGNSLRKVSLAYQRQIVSVDFSGIGNRNWFSDSNTSNIFDSFQHFLFDACSLRDYLSEAVNEFIVFKEFPNQKKMITSHAKLVSILKPLSGKSNLLNDIVNASEENGWLELLTNYRNVITHVCPISQFNMQSSVFIEKIDIVCDKKVARIKAPLPANPREIRFERDVTRTNFSELERIQKEFSQRAKDPDNSLDMLEYCSSVTKNLVTYAVEIAAASDLDAPPIKLQL